MIDLSLLPDFISEAGEHLEEMEAELLRLEENPGNREVLNDIFRCAHTIKGSAVYLGLEKIGELAHKLESLLEILRRGKPLSLDREMIDTLIAVKDRIAMLMRDIEQSQVEQTPIADVIERIERIANRSDKLNPPAPLSELEPKPFLSDKSPDEGISVESSAIPSVDEELPELDEVIEEAYDKELFEIFTQHLQENLSLIKTHMSQLPDSEAPAEILTKSLELINSLQSSANYMEYYKLGALYDKWRTHIEAALEQIDSGGSADIPGLLTITDRYTLRIENHFVKQRSQIEEKEELAAEEETPETPSLNFAEAEVKTEAGEGTSIVEPELESVSAKILETPPASGTKEPEQPLEYQALFEELDDVFAPVTAEAKKAVSETESEYSGLFEELDDVFIEPGSIIKPKVKPAPAEPEAPEIKPFAFPPEVEERLAAIEREEAVLTTDLKPPETKSVIEVVSEPEAVPLPEPKIEMRAEKTVKQTLRVDARKIDSLMNQVGELVVSRAWFSQLYREMRELQHQLQQHGRLDSRELKAVRSLTFKLSEATVGLGRVANDLQEGVMKVRMLPIAQLFNRYPRLIRDLTHGTDKNVRLEIKGEDTELDKMIIEEISDPLVHILRNAVDHGCETVEERRASGKPEHSTIRLESYHESNHVVIEVQDDGRGIDTQRVKAKALEKNLYSKDELDRMTQKDLMGIIMKPGFSTAAQVTKTSGRGVGMDVVKKNVEKLNGTIEIDSKAGTGTRFRIKIPLTLAIIRALLVRIGTEIFTIPMAAVEETLRIYEKEISVIEGIEVIHLRDSTLSLLRLTDIFGVRSAAQEIGKSFVVVVNAGMRQVGLVVDELIGQEEAVIKPLVDYLQERSGFSGATILGDGRISLILDVYELVNLSIEKQIRKYHSSGFMESGIFGKTAESSMRYENITVH